MKDIHTKSDISPFLKKLFGLLSELRETRDGQILYDYLTRSLADWEEAQAKTIETYIGFIRLLIESVTTVLPADSVIKTHLKLLQARMEPPIAEFELSELNDAIESAADVLSLEQGFPSAELNAAIGPVMQGISDRANVEKPVPKPTPKSAKTGKFPAPMQEDDVPVSNETEKPAQQSTQQQVERRQSHQSANSSNLFALDDRLKKSLHDKISPQLEQLGLSEQAAEHIKRWTASPHGENKIMSMPQSSQQTQDNATATVGFDENSLDEFDEIASISSDYRAHLDEAREQMLRLQKDFIRQVRTIVAQSAEFGVSLDLEIDVLREAETIEDIEDRRQTILKSLQKLSETHTGLAKKFDSAQSYLSIIEADNQSLNDELDRVRLLSLTDELTSLPNRRAFIQRLEDEVSRVKRYGFPLSLVLIDIDHFKQINDKFGHVTGDAMLRAYAEKILSGFRHHDMVARYGGEEFAVILPNTELKGVLRALAKVKSRVPEVFVKVNGLTIPAPHFSAGVVEYKSNELPANLVERVDNALYRAKRLGRNRIEVAEEDGPAEPVESPASTV